MIADWRFLGGTQIAAVTEVEALADAGLRVAVAHLEDYRAVHLKRAPLGAPIQQLINAGRVDHVLLGDRTDARLLIVRQASTLQFAGGATSGIRAPKAIVVADRAPVRGDDVDHRYTPAACTKAMLRLFEVDPVWCPQDAGVRAALRTQDPVLALTSTDLPAVIDNSGWVAERTAASPDRPIVGTDLCDAGNWPADLPDALTVHKELTGVDVRVRLPDRPKFTAELPGEWLVYAAGDLEQRPFLHQLDFYLHFPHPRAAELAIRPALEAAALGVVVVLSERHAALFGDAAIYCEPDEVASVISRYATNPAKVIAKAHHPRIFVDRIMELVRPAVTTALTAALPMQ
jgi:hypothetical protein